MNKQWGNWHYDPNFFTLGYQNGYVYFIDLNDCTNSSEILDWLLHLAGKSWITPEDLGNLIYALDELADHQLRDRLLKSPFQSLLDNPAKLE